MQIPPNWEILGQAREASGKLNVFTVARNPKKTARKISGIIK